MQFKDLNLIPPLLRALEDVGYETATPVQEQAIPLLLEGRDILACAKTGSGKTAAFLLPTLQKLHATRRRLRMPRALVIVPTRELAQQVAENFAALTKHLDMSQVTLIGGESMQLQERALQSHVDLIIATPGRLLDLYDRGKLMMIDVQTVILDEADRMFDMGFIPDIERIMGLLPNRQQTLLFSATLEEDVRKLARTYLKDQAEISVTPSSTVSELITHYVIHVPSRQKRQALRALIRHFPKGNAMLFCNRKSDISLLARSFQRHGFNIAVLHGDLDQGVRNKTLADFKEGKIDILIASNVAARGIDVDELAYVYNFEVPFNPEEYVHRIGRTGRAGNTGIAITLVDKEELKNLAAVEKIIRAPIPVWEDTDGILANLGTDADEVKPARSKQQNNKEARQREKPAPKKTSEKSKAQRHEPEAPKVKAPGFGDFIPAFFNVAVKSSQKSNG